MKLPEPAPVRLPFAATAPAIVQPLIVGVPTASMCTPSDAFGDGSVPDARMVEPLMNASTLFVIVFCAAARPIATLVNLPLVLRMSATAKPPASAVIVEVSVARTRTPPAAVIPQAPAAG